MLLRCRQGRCLLFLLLLCAGVITAWSRSRSGSSGSNTAALAPFPDPDSAPLSISRPRRPVFLKFYKVGSESVVDFFLRMSVDPGDSSGGRGGRRGGGRGYKSWVAKTPSCDGLPMDHKTLWLYIKHGADIGTACARIPHYSSFAVDLVTVLRNPAERFLSQFFFFSGPLVEQHLFSSSTSRIHKNINDTGGGGVVRNEASAMRVQWRRMLMSPLNISREDMQSFLVYLQKKEGQRGGFFPRLSLQCYESVLGRQPTHSPMPPSSSSTGADIDLYRPLLRRAMSALPRFTAVGTTEHMPSLFVLLAMQFSHPLADSCLLHNRHDHKKQRFAKPLSSSLQPGVMDAIQAFVRRDTLLWEKALRTHEQQLQAFNHSLASATALWQQVCEGAAAGGEVMTPQVWVDHVRVESGRLPSATSDIFPSSSYQSRGHSSDSGSMNRGGSVNTEIFRNRRILKSMLACSICFTAFLFCIKSRS